MRALVVALALLVGFTAADAKEADLVKLRDQTPKAAAKPTAKKTSPTRAKKKPPARKTVAKSKPKKAKKAKKESSESEEVRLRPMP